MTNIRTGKAFTDAPTMTRGGFLKGILASGIAPSITLATLANAESANATVGGMMRNVGARVGMMGGGGGWKNPYVTDGLVAMWDAEWNAGGGMHDANATTWVDLSVNGYDLNVDLTKMSFSDKIATINAGSVDAAYCDNVINDGVSQECVMQSLGLGGNFFLIDIGVITCGFFIMWGHIFNAETTRASIFDDTYVLQYGVNSSVIPNGETPNSALLYRNGINYEHGAFTFTLGETSGRIAIRGGYDNLLISNYRVYNRPLTQNEILHNYLVDKARFNLP